MNKTAAAIVLLLLARTAHAAAAVSISLSPGAPVTAPASDFTTLPFIAYNAGGATVTALVTWSADAALTLISNPGPVALAPGASEIIPLTFLIPDAAAAPVSLTVALIDANDPANAASAAVSLDIESAACARFGDLPDRFRLTAGRQSLLAFTVERCGAGHPDLDLAVDAGPHIETGLVPAVRNLAPGGRQRVALALTPRPARAGREHTVRLEILSDGKPLDTRTITVIVRPGEDAPLQTGARPAIPLRLTIDHTSRSSLGAHSSLRMAVPMAHKGNTTVSADAHLDDSSGSFVMRRSYLDLNLNGTRVIGGNQHLAMSGVLRQGTRLYEGWRVDRPAPGGMVSVFTGSNAGADALMLQWLIKARPGLDLRLTRLSEQGGADAGARFAADMIRAAYIPHKRMSLDAELAHARETRDGAEREGAALRLGGSYQGGGFQLSANFQTGHKDFPGDGRVKKLGLRAVFTPARRTRFFAEFQRDTAYREEPDAPAASVPYRHDLHSAGFSRPVLGGVMLFASYNSRSSDIRDANSPASPASARQEFFVLKMSRKISHFTVAAEMETGDKTRGADRADYRELGVSLAYRNNGLTLNADLNRAQFFTDAGVFSGGGRTSSLSLGYSFSNALLFGVNWRSREADAGSGGSGDRFEFTVEKRFRDTSSLAFAYEINRGAAGAQRMVRGTWSKSLDLKIPFSGAGRVRGAVYHDLNRNGARDPGEPAVAGAALSLNRDFRAVTNERGEYAFEGLLPGSYTMTLDSASYAAGLKPGADLRDFSVGGGRTVDMDIPMNSTVRLAGRVRVRDTGTISRRGALSPAALRIILLRDGRPMLEAFTDKNGEYCFEDLDPGAYRIALDETWLGAGVQALGAAAHDVPDSPGAADLFHDFEIGAKQKQIITTYQK